MLLMRVSASRFPCLLTFAAARGTHQEGSRQSCHLDVSSPTHQIDTMATPNKIVSSFHSLQQY